MNWYNCLFQILFICGLACIIGLERTFRFFVQRKKIKSSLAFFGGIIIVLLGWPLIGMIIESYGFFLLFRYSTYACICLCRMPTLKSSLRLDNSKNYIHLLKLVTFCQKALIISSCLLQWFFPSCHKLLAKSANFGPCSQPSWY